MWKLYAEKKDVTVYTYMINIIMENKYMCRACCCLDSCSIVPLVVEWSVSIVAHFLLCVYSNFRNDVPRVAQRYGTIAAHTRRRASVLVVFVVFCVHMYSFAGLIRQTPPPTFSDTAITDRHSE